MIDLSGDDGYNPAHTPREIEMARKRPPQHIRKKLKALRRLSAGVRARAPHDPYAVKSSMGVDEVTRKRVIGRLSGVEIGSRAGSTLYRGN